MTVFQLLIALGMKPADAVRSPYKDWFIIIHTTESLIARAPLGTVKSFCPNRIMCLFELNIEICLCPKN